LALCGARHPHVVNRTEFIKGLDGGREAVKSTRDSLTDQCSSREIEEGTQDRILCADEVCRCNVLLNERLQITIHADGAAQGLIFNDIRYFILYYNKIAAEHGIGDDVSDAVALQTVTANYPDVATNLIVQQ
jgi:hypothetical protein